MVKTMVRQAAPLQPMEIKSEVEIHLQPTEDPARDQVDVSKGGCDPEESPCWSRLLAGPVTLWREEMMLEQVWDQNLLPCVGPVLEPSIPEGLKPVETSQAGAVCEELQPLGRALIGEVCGGLILFKCLLI
ncbi:hypothetical protein llap_16145 [Limosa lapponica baueri]|uniref:Uncharacterized protein n=1 Tax=Limosa lapponica baueri TaxID=1758121 RepID=A0A2I0TID0_LIMLA|nr:hypothetical protein llap_16145 [Limosa lapponica baueri]